MIARRHVLALIALVAMVSVVPLSSSAARPPFHEEWAGEAPGDFCLCPSVLPSGPADIHEFTLPASRTGGLLTVQIFWSTGSGITYDLDLYVDYFDAEFGEWFEIGGSAGGQTLVGDAFEYAEIDVFAAGTYRTRVVNWASTETAYEGAIDFAPYPRR